jgi:hypothetical protein
MGARLWQHRIGRATAAEARRAAARFPMLNIGKTVDCAAPLRQLIEIHDRNCRDSGILAPLPALGPAPRRLRGRTGTHRGISFPMWSCIFEASIFIR